jgi:hypothetical protein
MASLCGCSSGAQPALERCCSRGQAPAPLSWDARPDVDACAVRSLRKECTSFPHSFGVERMIIIGPALISRG